MGNIIVVVILVIILVFAVHESMGHFKGEGSCCNGGGCPIKPEKKKLKGKKVQTIKVYIEGMHCDHCKKSVENAINAMEGAVAKVNLKKGIAMVSTDRHIELEAVRLAVKKAGFNVTDIEEE